MLLHRSPLVRFPSLPSIFPPPRATITDTPPSAGEIHSIGADAGCLCSLVPAHCMGVETLDDIVGVSYPGKDQLVVDSGNEGAQFFTGVWCFVPDEDGDGVGDGD